MTLMQLALQHTSAQLGARRTDICIVSHWLPTAAERGEVSASDAFELYRYACNANHPQLKAVSLEATHTDTIDASILTFEQEQSRALPTEHVDDLVRYDSCHNDSRSLH